MRVYEHGFLWTEMKTTCPSCSCDFIYRPKDIKDYIEYDFNTRTGKAYKYVNCPECNRECIYTDPSLEESRTYNDSLVGTPTGEDDSNDVIYDGGDEDETNEENIHYDGGDEDTTP